MIVPGSANPLLMAGGGYQISRSVRLRSSATAYFSRTPSVAGNRKTWTWSGWVKRGALGSNQTLFSCIFAANNNSTFHLSIEADNLLKVGLSSLYVVTTTQVFRDPSAWYHIVFAYDSTQATSTNRWKLYVNGVAITSYSAAVYPNLNDDWAVNATQSHDIGRLSGYAYNFDGYLTEINFIDGQALTPASFGETDVTTGVWKPKKYAGTYGTNGFYLNFSDNSAATAAAIGKDSSGNGNNWTPNNISVSAGANYDSMLDVPTPWADGGNGRGNYCVLNPLFGSTNTISDANLTIAGTTSGNTQRIASIGVASGKWYFETTMATNVSASSDFIVGISNLAGNLTTNYPGQASDSYAAYAYGSNIALQKVNNNTFVNTTATQVASGDVIGIAFDLDNSKFWISKNGVWVDSGNPSTGANSLYTLASGSYIPSFRCSGGATNSSANINFGQRPFSYTPPTGFKALNTQNLPDSTIKKGSLYFDATPYTGSGTTQSIVNAGAFQPDLVWTKRRDAASDHRLRDGVRGVNNVLYSNLTNADSTETDVTSFNSNGFTVNSNNGWQNLSGATYAAWQWKKGATPGFDIVTYNGNLSTTGTASINHNLGVAPSMIISKARVLGAQDNGQWVARHTSLGNWNKYLRLNTTDSVVDSTANGSMSAPTSTTFPTNWTSGMNSASPATFVAYLFAEVAGFSKFGSYTGNGSADGPFVYCGFRPRFVLFKAATGTTYNWAMYDAARDTYNILGNQLAANSSAAEGTFQNVDFLSNGFKVRGNNNINESGATIIYAAFAENPFKYSLAR
jgi:hypothetical protein